MLRFQRQLGESALVVAAEAKRLVRDFNRIAQLTGEDNVTVRDVDGPALGERAWVGFIDALVKRFRSHSVPALEIPARAVFDRYFAGTPPFEHRSSKEFPDAFVLEALARYCKNDDISMYVVSGDAALRKAAAERDTLLPLETIEDILAAATAEAGGDLEAIADEIFAGPGFDDQLTEAIQADLDFVDFAYYGSLSDVSVVGASSMKSSASMVMTSRPSMTPRSASFSRPTRSSPCGCAMWTRLNCVTRTTTLFRPNSKPQSTPMLG